MINFCACQSFYERYIKLADFRMAPGEVMINAIACGNLVTRFGTGLKAERIHEFRNLFQARLAGLGAQGRRFFRSKALRKLSEAGGNGGAAIIFLQAAHQQAEEPAVLTGKHFLTLAGQLIYMTRPSTGLLLLCFLDKSGP